MTAVGWLCTWLIWAAFDFSRRLRPPPKSIDRRASTKNSCIYSDPCSNPNATPRSTHQGVRSIPVRTGDEVVVTAGDHRKKAGKVIGVDRKKMKIHVEGITREKAGAKEAGKSACVVFAVVLGWFGW